MLVQYGLATLRAEWHRSVVCIGTFDGVHLGHRAVIGETVRRAHLAQTPAVVVTFDRHPLAVLAPNRCPEAITSLSDRLELFGELGAAIAVVLTFDEALARMPATQFLDDILVAGLRAGEVVMGHDFAFGKGREGTPEWLASRIATTVAPPVEVGGTRVSSTTIRRLIGEGEVRAARAMLARPHWISGVVVAGEQLGRRIGFPTINVARAAATLVPPDGVYAGACRTGTGVFHAAISIGCRPAVGGTSRAIEAYLLDYPGDDLYGQAVRLDVADRVRDELHTATLDELKAQIERDVAHISATLSARDL